MLDRVVFSQSKIQSKSNSQLAEAMPAAVTVVFSQSKIQSKSNSQPIRKRSLCSQCCVQSIKDTI